MLQALDVVQSFKYQELGVRVDDGIIISASQATDQEYARNLISSRSCILRSSYQLDEDWVLIIPSSPWLSLFKIARVLSQRSGKKGSCVNNSNINIDAFFNLKHLSLSITQRYSKFQPFSTKGGEWRESSKLGYRSLNSCSSSGHKIAILLNRSTIYHHSRN